jgi:hypothetical protein
MDPLQSFLVQCPHCWEQIDLLVDCSLAPQEYIEDCSVCCSPLVITVTMADDGSIEVAARAEND